MEEPLDEAYFNWLYSMVASVEVPTPSLTYYTMLSAFHSFEFVWTVVGDDNRAAEGIGLRREFEIMTGIHPDTPWMHMGCSVLEMLIAFAREAEFQTGKSFREWFWIFVENLGLKGLSDSRRDVTERVLPSLDRLVWRTYRRNGHGGLFPLRNPGGDQTKIEIWYQFCAYLIEFEADGRL